MGGGSISHSPRTMATQGNIEQELVPAAAESKGGGRGRDGRQNTNVTRISSSLWRLWISVKAVYKRLASSHRHPPNVLMADSFSLVPSESHILLTAQLLDTLHAEDGSGLLGDAVRSAFARDKQSSSLPVSISEVQPSIDAIQNVSAIFQ